MGTLTCKQEDGNLKLKEYHKATHIDQYLNFRSNQPLQHKLAVVRTLHKRAESIITAEEDRDEEKGKLLQP